MEYMWMQTFGLPTDSSIPSEKEKQLSTGLATVQLQVERNPLRESKLEYHTAHDYFTYQDVFK
jgi:hypothetical protein